MEFLNVNGIFQNLNEKYSFDQKVNIEIFYYFKNTKNAIIFSTLIGFG